MEMMEKAARQKEKEKQRKAAVPDLLSVVSVSNVFCRVVLLNKSK